MVQSLQRWEYLVESEPTVQRVDDLGADGWELVQIADGGRAVFRRPALTFIERVTLEQRARYFASLGIDSPDHR